MITYRYTVTYQTGNLAGLAITGQKLTMDARRPAPKAGDVQTCCVTGSRYVISDVTTD
jgi:hypothetical protein